MVFRNFRFNVIIRVLVICGTVLGLFALLLYTDFYATTFGIGALLIYEIYSLIRYVEKTNKDLKRFFDSIRYSDFSQSFTGRGLGKSFEELSKSFTRVTEEFKKARKEKEESFRYLQTVVQHVGTGLVTFDAEGEVSLINNAAKKILNVTTLKNIKTLHKRSIHLTDALLKLRTGEKTLIKFADKGELFQLSLHAAEFKLEDKLYKLIAITNIQSELEEKEMEAWQNLIRVLTHEIMNSVTPISSLAKTISMLLPEVADDGSDLEDITTGINTIQKRSEGLIHFVNNYRNLTKIPKPEFETVNAGKLLEYVRQLMENEISKNNVEVIIDAQPENMEITLDPRLIEQVLINLTLNSLQALANVEKPRLELSAFIDATGRPQITVKDNGTGIPKEVQEKIFIPFFTTRQEGSGIGLSLSRQIMRQHRGKIQVNSEPGEFTKFTLIF